VAPYGVAYPVAAPARDGGNSDVAGDVQGQPDDPGEYPSEEHPEADQ
jgi:hypothetical protein